MILDEENKNKTCQGNIDDRVSVSLNIEPRLILALITNKIWQKTRGKKRRLIQGNMEMNALFNSIIATYNVDSPDHIELTDHSDLEVKNERH